MVDVEGRNSNYSKVKDRGLPKVQQLPSKAGPLAIVASGPSVREHLGELREWPGEVWAINGAYDYLLDQEIVPQGFFAVDPLPGLVDYVRRANPVTTFYIASTCDLSVFDALEGYKVQTFNSAAEDMDYNTKTDWLVGGGTTALTRAPWLGLLQGWRDITLFGADSSFNGRVYCYDWGRYKCDIDTPRAMVSINGEGPFETELGLMKQVSQLCIMERIFQGRLKFKCDGLMAAFMRAPTMNDDCIEIVKNGTDPSKA